MLVIWWAVFWISDLPNPLIRVYRLVSNYEDTVIVSCQCHVPVHGSQLQLKVVVEDQSFTMNYPDFSRGTEHLFKITVSSPASFSCVQKLDGKTLLSDVFIFSKHIESHGEYSALQKPHYHQSKDRLSHINVYNTLHSQVSLCQMCLRPTRPLQEPWAFCLSSWFLGWWWWWWWLCWKYRKVGYCSTWATVIRSVIVSNIFCCVYLIHKHTRVYFLKHEACRMTH